MIVVRRYLDSDKDLWNIFNAASKNHLFMFDRNYMDYHRDRFRDHSLMLYNDDKLIAILPISEHGIELRSHGGLTYGGFITNEKMKQHTMNDCFNAVIAYMKEYGFSKLLYKPIPHMFHIQPAEEDSYALYVNGAEVVSIEPSTVVNLCEPLSMPKGRKSQISRARREGVVVEESSNADAFSRFIDLENYVLKKRHNLTAVHTAKELQLLHDRFPNNIHLLLGKYGDEIISGTVLFEYEQVVHTQYLAANDLAREIGALDLVIKSVIDKYAGRKHWLDFGISTENAGQYLNEGLISQKEGFGGRTNVYYKWILSV